MDEAKGAVAEVPAPDDPDLRPGGFHRPARGIGWRRVIRGSDFDRGWRRLGSVLEKADGLCREIAGGEVYYPSLRAEGCEGSLDPLELERLFNYLDSARLEAAELGRYTDAEIKRMKELAGLPDSEPGKLSIYCSSVPGQADSLWEETFGDSPEAPAT